ncbi:hypothetical protein E2C01_059978 [Portunus trituberculatus]|uniref:Uncharacterized protein n=1 Tax=Portunus trituberculatus TaxID=210409 RepID=A0A5B7H427_PORTR|nr:hypothetical protein [Portunus trituberculatus]
MFGTSISAFTQPSPPPRSCAAAEECGRNTEVNNECCAVRATCGSILAEEEVALTLRGVVAMAVAVVAAAEPAAAMSVYRIAPRSLWYPEYQG